VKQTYIGKKIKSIDIAMISPQYLEYIEGKTWMSDVGVQITLEDDSYFSIFYNEDTDVFNLYERTLADHLKGVEHYMIDLVDNEIILKLKNLQILDIEVIEKIVEEHNYNGDIIDSHKIPVEFLIKLEEDNTIQVATVNVHISSVDSSITEIYYNPEGNVWIGIGEVMEIK
jgi:hypothetical protein